MKITFLGADRQVTGSCTMIEWLPGRYCLVDYGMEQGENNVVQAELPVAPAEIEYVFLTHAHIDHSGRLPLLYKNGFRGTVYTTAETMNLCAVMLADSASIQESDAEWQTKKNQRAGLPPVEPLYTSEDAAAVMKLFRPCRYGEMNLVDEGLSLRFTDAGHLLGSSFLEVFLQEGDTRKTMVFSGDVGNTNQPIIRDPQPVKEADFLMIESTYGNRLHERTTDPIPLLTGVLTRTFQRGGTVIIPSFAIGRTQELLYFIREIKQRHLVPESLQDFPVYVDSPLANEATAIFLQCGMDCLDDETREVMRSGENPIWFEGLHTVVSADESKALNSNSEPKVIIASGGMCEGGRIRHHLKHNLWNEKNTILFVGYQAAGTLGRIIYDGAKTVKILGEPIESRAEIAMLSGISGHADREGLLNWLKAFGKKPAFVFVNHGDEDASTAFARTVTEELGLPAYAPCAGSCYDLARGEWIRLTEPVYRKKKRVKKAEPKKEKDPYAQLMAAVQKLSAYAGGMRDHANGELRELTDRILNLMKD